MKRNVLVTVVLILSFVGQAYGEVIYLNNGEILIGDIVSQTRGSITIKTEKGVRTVSKGRINKTSFNPAEEKRARAILKRREDAKKRREAESKRRAEERRRRIEAEARLREAEAARRREYPPYYYVMRSAFLPGWGLVEMGERGKGAFWMAMTGLAVGYSVSTRQAAEAAQRAYDRGVLEHTLLGIAPGGGDSATKFALGFYLNANVFGLLSESVDRYNSSLGVLATVYALQLLHTAYDAFRGPDEVVRGARAPSGFRFAFAVVPDRRGVALAGYGAYVARF